MERPNERFASHSIDEIPCDCFDGRQQPHRDLSCRSRLRGLEGRVRPSGGVRVVGLKAIGRSEIAEGRAVGELLHVS